MILKLRIILYNEEKQSRNIFLHLFSVLNNLYSLIKKL